MMEQAQRVAAPDLRLGDLAALGAQPRDVRRHQRLVELRETVTAPFPDLDVADQRPGDGRTPGRRAPEPEVDHRQASSRSPASRLLGQASPWLSRTGRASASAASAVESAAAARNRPRSWSSKVRAERVLPHLVAHQDRHRLDRQPTGPVGVHRPLDVAQTRQGRQSRTAGEPAEEIRRPLEPRQVPRRRPGRNLLQPHRRRRRVEVEDAERAGRRQAVGQAVGPGRSGRPQPRSSTARWRPPSRGAPPARTGTRATAPTTAPA